MIADGTLMVVGLAMPVTTLGTMAVTLQMWSRRMDQRDRELQVTARATIEQAAQYAAQTARLEQRVRVLEGLAAARRDADCPAH
ncbi:hypothetical protein [Novosphingobium sp.]|jgi:hypothetical protein|uniref:hypothetical protein n=1 Tax=Novosphingobium sp. TaxID=1874826 RepID=UPI002FDD2A9E